MRNSLIIEEFDYDLARAIEAQLNTIVSYGSKVRPVKRLGPLLHHHPNFGNFKHGTLHGIVYPAKDLDEKTRLEELNT